MPDQPMLPLTEPPDLLRRFVPTAHEACIRTGDLRIRMRTNDARLLRLADGADHKCGVSEVEWTMVCDPEMSPELGDPVVLNGQTMSVLSFGRACYVAMDHEKKEITGFVSAGISDDDWTGVLLPALSEMVAERWR